MADELTRQGVRNLDKKFGKPKKKPVDPPPREAFVCERHKLRYLPNGCSECVLCHMIFDFNGESW